MITYWQGYVIDHSKPHHRLGYWLLNLREAFKRTPRDFKFFVADSLCRFALWLTQEKTFTFGYFDHSKGNRAAELADNIRLEIIVATSSNFNNEVLEQLDELRQLASGKEYFNRDCLK
jgi:hypothetical protein